MILRRAEGRISAVEPNWMGRTVVCIATGPSLTPEQISAVRAAGTPTIAINDAYLMAPFADLLYFADEKWWAWHRERPEYRSFGGQKCSIYLGPPVKYEESVHVLERANDHGLSINPRAICTGSNSGYQALNIAALAGAARVLLVGYDGKPDGKRHHYFGDHPDRSHAPYEVIRARFREAIEPARKIGLEILNATPGSAIDCFRRVTLAEGLEPAARAALV